MHEQRITVPITMLSPQTRALPMVLSSVIIALTMATASAFVQSHPLIERPSLLDRPIQPTRTRTSAYAPRRTNYGALILFVEPEKNNIDGIDVSTAPGVNKIDPGTKLLLCILIDLVGIASFAAPGLGEATDVAWAPISAILINYLFGNGIFTALAFVEELLPGFDIIPTATIAWFIENANRTETTTAPPPPPGPAKTRPNDQAAPDAKSNKRPNIPDAIDVEVVG